VYDVAMKSLTLLHLYPNEMNLYGDRGNVLALYQQLAWRGVRLKVLSAPLGAWQASWQEADLIFMGGGQDAQQFTVVEDLHRHKAPSLKGLAQDGALFLGICGGFQFFGHYYKTPQGNELRGLSLLDAYTVAGSERFIGNVVLETSLLGRSETLVGFENHSGLTYLGADLPPLGKILVGRGNNGKDGTEGANFQNQIIGTYLHGALLPKNSVLSDALLSWAWQRRYGESLPPLRHAGALLASQAHEEALCVAKFKDKR
jgi:CobQ-like glutamine amidotransferase family enzyme